MASAQLKQFVLTAVFMFTVALAFTAATSLCAHANDNYLSVEVADPYIELHTGPGRGYPIFYIAERGEHVDILKQRTDWIKVRLRAGTPREKEGWVSLAQMAKTLTSDGQQLAVAYPDFDAYKKRRWEAGLMTGSYAGANIVSIYGGYHFTANISAEIEASQYFGSFSNGKLGTISLVHQPFPEWRLSPFLTLGVGRVYIEPKATLVETTNRFDSVVDAGIGVRYYLTRRFLLRAQYKNYVVLTNTETNQNAEEWKIGLSAFF
jgi:uncharacterized protein YgiM (DUF1202 family)